MSKEEITITHGITGSKYVISKSKQELIDVCNTIGKSIKSIYWSHAKESWVIRIKSKKHKLLLHIK